MMSGNWVAWRSSRSGMAMVVVVMMLLSLEVVVESTRVGEMAVVTLQPRGDVSSVVSWRTNGAAAASTRESERARARAGAGSNGVDSVGDQGGVVAVTVDDDPVWDAEAESPPAQRQRDRSLWGMSKRLVPTGPNPLHN